MFISVSREVSRKKITAQAARWLGGFTTIMAMPIPIQPLLLLMDG
jgi:hypothetical protein